MILLNVMIPGPPYAQQRHRWGKGRVYDPSAKDKESFMWQVKAACPMLKPHLTARISVDLIIWTASWTEDADNYLKFYMDALSPAKSKKKHRIKIDQSNAFAAWANDRQVDKINLDVVRGSLNEGVRILVQTVETPQKVLASNSQQG